MKITLYILLLCYIVFIVGTTWVSFKFVVEDGDSFETLKHIYDTSNMNLFGCLLQYISNILFFPVWWVCHIIYAFVNWLIHVGRRD